MRESLLIIALLCVSMVSAAPYGADSYGVGAYTIGYVAPPASDEGSRGGSGKIAVGCVEGGCAPGHDCINGVCVSEPVATTMVSQPSQPSLIERPAPVRTEKARSARTPQALSPQETPAKPSLLTGFVTGASSLTYPLRNPAPRKNPEIFYPLLFFLLLLLGWLIHRHPRPVLPYFKALIPRRGSLK